MGQVVQKLILFLGDKATKINPVDFFTQDNFQTLIDIINQLK